MLTRIIFLGASVLGIIFCISNALGIETFCETSGCSITKDFSLFGISLYWFGAVAFSLFIPLWALGATKILRFYALTVLAIDCVLLAILAFSAPCLSCMIVGGLFFLIGLSIFWEDKKNPQARAFTAVFIAWAVLFAPNAVNTAGELIGPQPVYGDETAEVKVFFSPSCPSCKDVVKEIIDQNKNYALFPVDKSFEDLKQICLLNKTYENTGEIDKALEDCWTKVCDNENVNTLHKLKLSFQTWCNKSYLAKLGKSSVPVIVSQSLMKGDNKENKEDINSIFNQGSSCSENSNTCTF